MGACYRVDDQPGRVLLHMLEVSSRFWQRYRKLEEGIEGPRLHILEYVPVYYNNMSPVKVRETAAPESPHSFSPKSHRGTRTEAKRFCSVYQIKTPSINDNLLRRSALRSQSVAKHLCPFDLCPGIVCMYVFRLLKSIAGFRERILHHAFDINPGGGAACLD